MSYFLFLFACTSISGGLLPPANCIRLLLIVHSFIVLFIAHDLVSILLPPYPPRPRISGVLIIRFSLAGHGYGLLHVHRVLLGFRSGLSAFHLHRLSLPLSLSLCTRISSPHVCIFASYTSRHRQSKKESNYVAAKKFIHYSTLRCAVRSVVPNRTIMQINRGEVSGSIIIHY